jgi:hypothetical protein
MADIHECAVITAAGVAIDQKVTATLGPHMAQSHGCQLSDFVRTHASQFAPSSAFRKNRRAMQNGRTGPWSGCGFSEALAPAIWLRADRASPALQGSMMPSDSTLELGAWLGHYHPATTYSQ